jgi:hypothetical protein
MAGMVYSTNDGRSTHAAHIRLALSFETAHCFFDDCLIGYNVTTSCCKGMLINHLFLSTRFTTPHNNTSIGCPSILVDAIRSRALDDQELSADAIQWMLRFFNS